jgi:hypothetical protein
MRRYLIALCAALKETTMLVGMVILVGGAVLAWIVAELSY